MTISLETELKEKMKRLILKKKILAKEVGLVVTYEGKWSRSIQVVLGLVTV